MYSYSPIQVPRWLLLAWLGILFFYGYLGLNAVGRTLLGAQSDQGIDCRTNAILNKCLLDQLFSPPALLANLPEIILFSILFLCFFIIFWLNTTRISNSILSRLLLLIQVILALGIVAVLPSVGIASSMVIASILSVILVLEIVILLKKSSLTFTFLYISILLLFLIVIFSQMMQQQYEQNLSNQQQQITLANLQRDPDFIARLNTNEFPTINAGQHKVAVTIVNIASPLSPSQDILGLPLVLLSLMSFLILYMQLARAHAQLSAVNLELQRSTERIEALTKLTERQRLARELHDTLAQGLAGITMQLQATQAHLTQKRYPQAEAMMEHMRETVRALLKTSRSVIHDLRTTNIGPEQLPQAMQEEVDRFMLATGITCYADFTLLSLIPEDCCQSVIRALSEGLTNIARHAQARQVWIRITKTEETSTIEIQDDGNGFNPLQSMIQTGHYGLVGLQERARLLGGDFKVVSTPGEGTTLFFQIPNQRSEHTYA